MDRPHRPNPLTENVIPTLQRAGRPALIGGAIRDLARGGRSAFKSDLDFVVYGSRRMDFRDSMLKAGAVENKFGGFGLQIGAWHIDAWHLHDTWARTAGYREVNNLRDLLSCTFFDWDAVVFDLNSRKLITRKGYFARLAGGTLDITLEENPNPRGSLVRSLRRAALWNVNFGLRLTNFTLNSLQKFQWDELVELDTHAFSSPILRDINYDSLVAALRTPIWRGQELVTTPVPKSEVQLALPISLDDRTNLTDVGI